VAVLHQHMPHEAKLGLFAFALAEQPRLRVGSRGMGLVQSAFPMKIHFRVATAAGRGRRSILSAETLQGSPGLDQGTVHGEMLVRQQFGQGLIHHSPNRPERMVLGHSSFRAKIAEYRLLLHIVTPPSRCLRIRSCYP